MTQASRPQADSISNYPFPSDPGPYSADQWAQYMQIVYTGDQQATQGPLAGYLNELTPADNGTNTVTVDTGAGYVNGHLLISSEQETFAIPAGPVAGRTDRVVMVENNQNVEVTQTTGGRPLLFPNDLSEYTATPAVPAYSARLAIVRGADGAGLPAIDQTTALYMVELYRYDINNVPTISNATDYRDFCRYSTLPLLRRRQGGNAADWSTNGTNNYYLVGSNVLMQVGAQQTNVAGTRAITFPVAFSNVPMVFVSTDANGANFDTFASVDAVLATGFDAYTWDLVAGAAAGNQFFFWMAIGPA